MTSHYHPLRYPIGRGGGGWRRGVRPSLLHPRNLLTACFCSFGDPNARPPTPQRTPTAVFSSPLLQTPKQNQSHFDETTGWTPRFAEEYSVFNATPGNLRGASPGTGAFHLDFAPQSPAPPSTGKKRPLSADDVALDIAARTKHLAAASATLAPVNPTRQLPPAPDSLITSHENAAAAPSNDTPTVSPTQQEHQEQQGQRSAKKSRRASASATAGKPPFSAQGQAQTATPPPSSRGGRKLAPKPRADDMQDQSFSSQGFASAQPPLPLNTAFVTGNPDDVFGYQLGPATAPPVTGTRQFWGFDMDNTAMDTSGMAIDVDLSAAGADLFQNPTQHSAGRPMTSMDWETANFQQVPLVGPSDDPQQRQRHPRSQHRKQGGQDHASSRKRPLAPKTAAISDQSPNRDYSFGSFQMMDNPYETSPGGVNPGLLFSQPTSSAVLDSGVMAMSLSMDPTSQQPCSSASGNMGQATANAKFEAPGSTAPMPAGKELPRSGSQGQRRKKLDRASVIASTKSSDGRPNLSRSFSESARGGKRTAATAQESLPTLAPARPVTSHQPSLPAPAASQGHANQAQSGRSGGRSSPLKFPQHNRLTSLTSIPENAANASARQRSPRRTEVKLVIDENGRAHTETIVSDEDESEEDPELDLDPFSSSRRDLRRDSWEQTLPDPIPIQDSDEEYSSSSDDEPIIIPSRNTSFNYPDPPRSSGSGASRPATAASSIFAQTRGSHRSSSGRPMSSTFRGQMRLDTADSMGVDRPQQLPQPQRPSTGGSLGDAAAQLRKVMQAVNPRRSVSGQRLPLPSASGNGQRLTSGQRSSSSTISEASLPETSPTQSREQGHIRCVCNRPEASDSAYLIKW